MSWAIVGPIKVDEASLTLSLSSKAGLGQWEWLLFPYLMSVRVLSMQKVTKKDLPSEVILNLTARLFNRALIEVTYDSVKDNNKETPGTFKGTVGIAKDKIKGINSATIKVRV